jgi:hypothetical protein
MFSPKCVACGEVARYHCETCGSVCEICIEHCSWFGHDWEDS